MPDSRPWPSESPRDWADAFAALPAPTPPADGWSRLARALDAQTPRAQANARRERRVNALVLLASAAVLAVVAWMPVAQLLAPAPTRSATIEVPPVKVAAASAARATPDQTTNVPGAVVWPVIGTDSLVTSDQPNTTTVASTTKVPEATSKSPRWSRPSGKRQTPKPAVAEILKTAVAAIPATAPPDESERLYAESAQLEALVAMARDDRVASASGAVITGELDARIGLIDAALSQPELTPVQRTSLWQQRVDVLRELAGVESTERWLAARGEQFGGALVRVD